MGKSLSPKLWRKTGSSPSKAVFPVQVTPVLGAKPVGKSIVQSMITLALFASLNSTKSAYESFALPFYADNTAFSSDLSRPPAGRLADSYRSVVVPIEGAEAMR